MGRDVIPPERRLAGPSIRPIGQRAKAPAMTCFTSNDVERIRPEIVAASANRSRGSGDGQVIDGAPNGIGEGRTSTASRSGTSRSLPGDEDSNRAARSDLVLHHAGGKRSDAVAETKPCGTQTIRRRRSITRSRPTGNGCCDRASTPSSRGFAAASFDRPAEFLVVDAGVVLRHRVLAPHFDSLLHGQGRGGGAEKHDRRHRHASGSFTC